MVKYAPLDSMESDEPRFSISKRMLIAFIALAALGLALTAVIRFETRSTGVSVDPIVGTFVFRSDNKGTLLASNTEISVVSFGQLVFGADGTFLYPDTLDVGQTQPLAQFGFSDTMVTGSWERTGNGKYRATTTNMLSQKNGGTIPDTIICRSTFDLTFDFNQALNTLTAHGVVLFWDHNDITLSTPGSLASVLTLTNDLTAKKLTFARNA